MNSLKLKDKLGLIYLYLIPVLSAAIGFGIGHISYLIYLPLWLLNACMMGFAVYNLGAGRLYKENKQQLFVGLLLIGPWVLFPVFAGMGPPPVTMSGWVLTAGEQQSRFSILILGGILLYIGFTLFKNELVKKGEAIYAVAGHAVITLGIPLFILNMIYWGFFLTEAFKIFEASANAKRPDWYLTIRSIFYVISVIEVALIYLSTAAFIIAIKHTRLFKPLACNWYLFFCFVGIVLTLLSPSLPEPLPTAEYLVSIPAIPFIMPYLIGVNFLDKSVTKTIAKSYGG